MAALMKHRSSFGAFSVMEGKKPNQTLTKILQKQELHSPKKRKPPRCILCPVCQKESEHATVCFKHLAPMLLSAIREKTHKTNQD